MDILQNKFSKLNKVNNLTKLNRNSFLVEMW